jgi:hypothetical protein
VLTGGGTEEKKRRREKKKGEGRKKYKNFMSSFTWAKLRSNTALDRDDTIKQV